MGKKLINLTVNGLPYEVAVDPRLSLATLLRDGLGLTGTKIACGEGECGACSVILDGKLVASCIIFGVEADGREVVTIEGVSDGAELSPLQKSFVDVGAVQCGYCTPGMVMAAKYLLDRNPCPTEDEIRWAIAGNLCRCTGYQKIVKAIALAASVR